MFTASLILFGVLYGVRITTLGFEFYKSFYATTELLVQLVLATSYLSQVVVGAFLVFMLSAFVEWAACAAYKKVKQS